MSKIIIRRPNGNCEDADCIRNYKGSCLYQRMHPGICEKDNNSEEKMTQDKHILGAKV